MLNIAPLGDRALPLERWPFTYPDYLPKDSFDWTLEELDAWHTSCVSAATGSGTRLAWDNLMARRTSPDAIEQVIVWGTRPVPIEVLHECSPTLVAARLYRKDPLTPLANEALCDVVERLGRIETRPQASLLKGWMAGAQSLLARHYGWANGRARHRDRIECIGGLWLAREGRGHVQVGHDDRLVLASVPFTKATMRLISRLCMLWHRYIERLLATQAVYAVRGGPWSLGVGDRVIAAIPLEQMGGRVSSAFTGELRPCVVQLLGPCTDVADALPLARHLLRAGQAVLRPEEWTTMEDLVRRGWGQVGIQPLQRMLPPLPSADQVLSKMDEEGKRWVRAFSGCAQVPLGTPATHHEVWIDTMTFPVKLATVPTLHQAAALERANRATVTMRLRMQVG